MNVVNLDVTLKDFVVEAKHELTPGVEEQGKKEHDFCDKYSKSKKGSEAELFASLPIQREHPDGPIV